MGISVHPDQYRTANVIYCAFTRLFGRNGRPKQDVPVLEGYASIPPSGKLRDLLKELPFIIDRLGCRILHLLPINPTPTTYARFGRFGSPYAALDLAAIDPALVVFDKRTTGIDQFRELTYAAHLRGARVFLDIVINHTGWGSVLQENHPEWFLRQADETFISPGAWGVTWEDLVELKHQNVALWDELSEVFLTWCRRGVDGFRCDAGYKVPVPAWQYIVARVQQEYPDTVFLLEGLGGAWEATEALLSEGGMQWAYSELFQNYSGLQVSGYLDHGFKQNRRVGLLVHYSETHDNERLAARGRVWSLLRNRLCGLTSNSGGFGFTCGVEWLATERINVHDRADIGWDNSQNLIPELAALNRLLVEHPCFFDGATLTRLSPNESAVYALLRESAEGRDIALVLVNLQVEHSNTFSLSAQVFGQISRALSKPNSPVMEIPTPKLAGWVDLLGQKTPEIRPEKSGDFLISLGPGAAYCLSPSVRPSGLHGDKYRVTRAQAAWALSVLNCAVPMEKTGGFDWRSLAMEIDRSPATFLAKLGQLEQGPGAEDLVERVRQLEDKEVFPKVVVWSTLDARRITPVPPDHWLLINDTVPFRATLNCNDGRPAQNFESLNTSAGRIACFPPRAEAAEATLWLERYAENEPHLQANIRYLGPLPWLAPAIIRQPQSEDLVLLTNGRGGMARICVDLGRVLSKYDCVLGANLHPNLPVDRHIFIKRIRVWVNADGFIAPLNFSSLARLESGPPAIWRFIAQAGDGRTVEIEMTAAMVEGRNTTVFQFKRPSAAQAHGKQLPDEADVRLTVRLDIEDRNFHWETKHNSGAEHHFNSHTQPLQSAAEGLPSGFSFSPASDRQLRVFCDTGRYHSQPEWSYNLPHIVEQSRGQTGNGDAFSPGWFEVPLAKGATAMITATADPTDPASAELEGQSLISLEPAARGRPAEISADQPCSEPNVFEQQLLRAVRAFVVRRGNEKTVIAGYPWFLDWGRDTFICARGLLAAGMVKEVEQIVLAFARFERNGTLPNTIFGEDASNRDTSDAPLWFGLVCEELGQMLGSLDSIGAPPGRTLLDVLESIALNYTRGTPNGIRMDPDSALIWSPSHFTWMDTNYPACTPREGYPVEIQALWIRLLRALSRLAGSAEPKKWEDLAAKALASVEKLFWREDRQYYCDVLLAGPGQTAVQATADDALRSNCLFLVSLGLSSGARARSCVEAARRHLVVPGALRTLAPLPVSVPLPIHGNDGRLLNDPRAPYWGRYEGDEDTRRKPAYHNGTAWTWTFPVFCESLARAWQFAPEAVAAAKAYLGSMECLMGEGCLGHLPEILDGDAPHKQRGCDAQAWGATEALRVWKLLQRYN